jgi:hypothetical protein
MRIALATAAAVLSVAGASSAAPGSGLSSWADLAHGWQTAGDAVFTTNDGGVSWHRIFTGGDQIDHVLRTSAAAGTVLVGSSKAVAFWTRDGGRHWYRGDDALGNAVGHGSLLFSTDGPSLLQVRPWPPRGELRCRGAWTATGVGPARPGLRRNVCAGPPPTRLHTLKVFTLPRNEEFAPDALVAVPAGVAAVSTDGSARQRPLAVVVYRGGHGTETLLQSTLSQETGFSGFRWIADWPRLTLQAEAGTAHAVWSSDDGGQTWSFFTAPAALRG